MPPKATKTTTDNTTRLNNELKVILETKSARLKVRLNSAENQIRVTREEYKPLLKDIDAKITSITKQVEENVLLVAEHTDKLNELEEKGDGQNFQIDALNDTIVQLKNEVKDLTNELDETRNRGLRKALICRSIIKLLDK